MDIQEKIQGARKAVMENPDGYGMPNLIVELDNQEITLFALDILSDEYTIQEQERIMFGIGRKMGVENPSQQIQEMLMICEAWKSIHSHPKGQTSPKDDPRRQEILVVEHWKPSEKIIENYELRVIRKGERVVDCILPEHPSQRGSLQVKSFYDGFLSRRRSNEDLARAITDFLRGKRNDI